MDCYNIATQGSEQLFRIFLLEAESDTEVSHIDKLRDMAIINTVRLLVLFFTSSGDILNKANTV